MPAIAAPESEAPPADQSPADLESPTSLPTVQVHGAVRSIALAIIATVAVVFALDWAQSFVISLLLGILFAYTLNPLVVLLERIRIPRVLGTGLVMLGVVCALVLGTYSLRGQMQTILDQVPSAITKLSVEFASLNQGQAGTMQKMQTAASQIEKATSQATGMTSTPKQHATRVVIDTPEFKLGNFLWAGSRGAAGLLGQAAMVVFLTFFLLLSGDTYQR